MRLACAGCVPEVEEGIEVGPRAGELTVEERVAVSRDVRRDEDTEGEGIWYTEDEVGVGRLDMSRFGAPFGDHSC